ncbi:MAG: DUF4105 domain-containing protein [Bacteroidota bacterium]|nr:DUF4105 domain-containing protein [Bacteroidota bacterium]
MKRIFLIALLFLSFFNLSAQQICFSDSVVISLITCSPGEEVYSKFGHTAIRINDSKKGIDLVFNYGIFSFETENFYYKFIKGETDYQLGIYDTRYFLPEYAERNSVVWEQTLNLTPAEKKNLIDLLLKNYEPQNRTYRYNFIFDNCATRPRDKIFAALKGYVRFQPVTYQKTFRQWVGMYVGTDTWLKFGIDLVFGIEADRTANISESMFLPETLMYEFQTAQIHSPNGQIRKLVADKKILVNKNNTKEQQDSWVFKPVSISLFLLVLGIILTIWDIKERKRHFKLFDTIILFVTGVGGVIVFYLMFFSVHPLVKSNLNLLWLNPLNLFVALFIWIKPMRVTLFFYQILNILLLLGALFAFALSAQTFNLAVFPIIVLLLMRGSSWFALTKRRIYKNKKYN